MKNLQRKFNRLDEWLGRKTVIYNCINCDREIELALVHSNKGWGQFCHHQCKRIYKKKMDLKKRGWETNKCRICGHCMYSAYFICSNHNDLIKAYVAKSNDNAKMWIKRYVYPQIVIDEMKDMIKENGSMQF